MSGRRCWKFEAEFPDGLKIDSHIVRLDHRPIVKQLELSSASFDQKTFTTTMYDHDDESELWKQFVEVFNRIWNFMEESQTTKPPFVLGTGKLTFYCTHAVSTPSVITNHDGSTSLGIGSISTGKGPLEPLEEWTLEGLFPSELTFGDPEWTEDSAVAVTWRYNIAKYKYFGVVLNQS